MSTDTNLNFVVHYAFAYPDSELRPADQLWGVGSMSIQTDKEPETVEEFKEIARHIGITNGYESVGITGIDQVEEEITDQGEILLKMVEKNDEYEKETRSNLEETVVIEGTVLDD